MIKLGKLIVVIATSTVIIPYSIAFIAYILYGRNYNIAKKWTNIIHPRKILAINIATFNEIKKLKFLKLYYHMISFFNKAPKEKIIKNILYGINNNCLDIYLPDNFSKRNKVPVVVFIYGGTWSTGDKRMYGLLCSNLSNILSCIVVCPNYTLYPKGFVDDMVQDVSDALVWIYSNIAIYGGDKNRLVLIGHSAGGHLCTLTLFELAMKNKISSLIDIKQNSSSMNISMIRQSKLELKDNHFNGENTKLDSVNNVEESFIMVQPDLGNDTSISFLDNSNNGASNFSSDNGSLQNEDNKATYDDNVASINDNKEAIIPNEISEVGESLVNITYPESLEASIWNSQVREDNKGNNSNINTIPLAGLGVPIMDPVGTTIVDNEENNPIDENMLFEKILPCVKLFIGLAGVYDIVDHYEFETWRGIEDLSKMARAMYDDQHFSLFSPTRLVQSLPDVNILPAIYLFHGNADTIVPMSSSLKYGETLSNFGHKNVNAIIFSDCDHYEICLDMMDEKRGWYSTIFSQIQIAFNKHV